MKKNEEYIYNEIYKIIKKITDKSLKRKNSEITKEIKIKIGEFGYKVGYDIASTEHNREWLYDIVWYEEDDNGLLINVPLVLESEISDRKNKGLRYDFEKILLSKSEYKVFICMAKNEYSDNAVSSVKQLLEKSFNKFKLTNKSDTILLLIWDDYNTGNLYKYILTK